MFAEAIEDILRHHCRPAVVRAIEAGGSPDALWHAVADAGFLELLRAEAEGGAGLPMPGLYAVAVQFGRHAAPLPFVDAIGARALVNPGVLLPDTPLALAPTLLRRPDGSLVAPLLPFGALAEHVLAADGEQLVLVPCSAAQRLRTGVPRSLIATLVWPDDSTLERLAGDASAVAPLAAALQAALLAGAMNRVFDMALQHCNQRSQFGRTLGKFQALQHQMALMAQHAAAAGIAAESAFQTAARAPSLLAAAVAKARSSEAAPEVANIAHALHGAIGVTEEYDLQLFTRRLHEGRMAHGSESYWNRLLGEQVLAGSATLAEFARTV